jgi:hypothetical protein
MEFRVAVRNYDVVYIKGEFGALREWSEFRVESGRNISIKVCTNGE